MNNIKNKLLIVVFVFASVISCKKPDNAIYDVFDGITHGAVLRELAVADDSYDKADPNSKFEIMLEEQDEQSGGLLDKVNVYVTFTDKHSGTGADSKEETLLKSYDGASFTTSDNGYPMNTFVVTLGEVTNLFNLAPGQFDAGDLIDVRFEIVLSDGRTFSKDDGSGSTQGSYFASPYAYTRAIFCAPMAGDYKVDLHDSYGDGWQTNDGNGGDGIQVTVTLSDGSTTVIEVGMCSAYQIDYPTCEPGDGYEATTTVTIPTGATSAQWYFPGDTYGEISFEVYAPTSELLFASGAPGATGKGSLPIVKCQ